MCFIFSLGWGGMGGFVRYLNACYHIRSLFPFCIYTNANIRHDQSTEYWQPQNVFDKLIPNGE